MLYGHPLIMDTSLLQTVFFVPGESPYIFPKFKPLNTDIEPLKQTTDTFFLCNEQILI